MLVIIFSYNREKMLKSLLNELLDHEVIVIDDGSDWIKTTFRGLNTNSVHHSIIETNHEGKKGFWKKWVIAQQIALGSSHNYFLLIPDDFTDIDLSWLKSIEDEGWGDKMQGWRNDLFAINILNDKRTECWGKHSTNQEPLNIDNRQLNEVGFVDCGFFTNRKTLSNIEIHEVSRGWFTRADISSGVGHQLTKSFREIGVKMMMPTPSLCKHGQHFSQMHHDYREDVELSLDMNVYCVNIEDRIEKWHTTIGECKKIDVIPKQFKAIKETPGFIGCRKSHLKLLSEIKQEGIFAIIEDDIKFLSKDPLKDITKAMSQLPSDWDMLYLGATLNKDLVRHSENLFKLTDAWTTHAIIFNNQNGVVDFILEAEPNGKIDVFYLEQVQTRFKCFITHPMIATQREGYSDVINRPVDYKVITERFNKHTK